MMDDIGSRRRRGSTWSTADIWRNANPDSGEMEASARSDTPSTAIVPTETVAKKPVRKPQISAAASAKTNKVVKTPALTDCADGYADPGHPVTRELARNYHPAAKFLVANKPKWPRNWLHIALDHKAAESGIDFAGIISRLKTAIGGRLADIYDMLNGKMKTLKPADLSGIKSITGFDGDQVAAMDIDWRNQNDFFGTYEALIKRYGVPGHVAAFEEEASETNKSETHDAGAEFVTLPIYDLSLDMPGGKYDHRTWAPHYTRPTSMAFVRDDLQADPSNVIVLTNVWKATGEPRIGESDKIYVDVSRAAENGSKLVFRFAPDGEIFIRDVIFSEDGATVSLTAENPRVRSWYDEPLTNVTQIGIAVHRSTPILPASGL